MATSNSFLTSYLNSKTKSTTSLTSNSTGSSNSFLTSYLSSKSNATTSATVNTGSTSNSILSSYLSKDTTVTEDSTNNGGILGGIGYTFEKIGLGVLQSIEGIWDYTASGIAKLFGADDWAEEQVATDWVNYNHADEWYNPSSAMSVVGDVASGIGTSLPAIAAVAAATVISGGTLTPAAATLVSSSIAGLSAAGTSLKEAYQTTGELGLKEYGYATASGVVEGVIEGAEDILGFGSGTVIDNIATTFSKRTAGVLAKNSIGTTLAKSFVGEALEEGISEIISPYLKRMTIDPDAENATLSEVGYAALIGGLSGMAMGGFSSGVTATTNIVRGNSIINKGSTDSVLQTAANISARETTEATGYESAETVSALYNELKTSMDKTGGQITTIKQKQLLGQLERANTAFAFEPMVTSSAQQIYQNAEVVAEKMNGYYKDADGNPITVTAAELTAGIDATNDKTLRKTLTQALKTNSKLRGLAIVDATGRLTMDTKAFADGTLRGEALFNQSDLNRFVETASDQELNAVGERLGIQDWNSLTEDELKGKIIQFAQDGGIDSYKTENATVKQLITQAEATTEAKKNLPRRINLQEDGVYRYTTEAGIDIAITKQGDSYRVYDYTDKRMSKSLTKQELNKVLQTIHAEQEVRIQEQTAYLERQQQAQQQAKEQAEAQQKAQAEAQEQARQQENERQKQARELDEYARKNVKGYNKLSAANQSMIRSVLRQGRLAGIEESRLISIANVSAHSGLNILFSKKKSFVAANGTYADGAVDLRNNRIIINPEAKTRTHEMILIHELTHVIYNLKDGTLQVAEGLKAMSAEEKENIRKRYSKVGQTSSIIIADEINAHFAEQTLSNKNILERLVADKPTVKERILNFFKGAKSDYEGDAKLSKAAEKLYKQYKKLFDDFSARNYQNNAVGTTRALKVDESGNVTFMDEKGQTNENAETIRYAQMNNKPFSENVKDIATMSDEEALYKKSKENYIKVMDETPEVITKYVKDAENLEVIMTFEALYLSVRKDGVFNKENSTKYHYHNLGVELASKLPEFISNPEAIIRVRAKNGTDRLNLLTTVQTKKGNNGIISIELGTVKDINSKNNKYNLIVTAFSADDNYTRNTINGAIKVEYEKNDLSQVNPQLHKWLSTVNEKPLVESGNAAQDRNALSTDIISDTSEKSNSKTKKSSKKVRYALSEEQEQALTDRGVEGDKLLDVIDLSDEIQSVGGEITQDAKAVLYHATTAENAKKIIESGKMYGKEPNLYFSTKSDGEILGYGDTVIQAEIPLEKLEVNDVFDKEIHLTMAVKPYQLTNIRYALPTTDSDGRALTEKQQDYFKDSKVRDKDGKLLTVYHGSKAKFTEFSHEFISNNGSVFGQGFYFTDAKGMAESYTNSKGQLLKGYLNITKPLSSSEITLSREELRSLIKELDPTGDNILTGYDTQNGKGYPSKTWYNRALNDTVDSVLSNSKNDIEIIDELAITGGIVKDTLTTVRSLFGYDGYIISNNNSSIFVAFESNQFKNATNTAPTADSDIRFALQIGDSTVGTKGDYQFDTESDKMIADLKAQNDIENFLPKGLSKEFVNAIRRSRFTYPRLYRGMEAAELEFIKDNGYIKSKGEYNFANQQNQTLFSYDARYAFSYATGFAPQKIADKFFRQGKPAYLVEIANDAGLNFEYNSAGESFTRKEIDVGYITRIFELRYNESDKKVYAKDIKIDGMNIGDFSHFTIHGKPLFYQDKTTGTILYAVQDADGYENGKYISEADPTFIIDYSKINDPIFNSDILLKMLKISGNESDLVEYTYPDSNSNVRYALPETDSEIDKSYNKALESGDNATAQSIIDELAKKNGYTDVIYHGTDKFGFTEFDTKYSDDGISIFATSELSIAKSYGKNLQERKISDTGKTFSNDELLECLRQMGYQEGEIKIYAKGDIEERLKLFNESADNQIFSAKNSINIYSHRDTVDNDMLNTLKSDLDKFVSLVEKINKNPSLSNLEELQDFMYYANEHPFGYYMSFPKWSDIWMSVSILEQSDEDIFFDTRGRIDYTKNDIISMIIPKGGIYKLYGKPGVRLEIDGNGAYWSDIRTTLKPQKETTVTATFKNKSLTLRDNNGFLTTISDVGTLQEAQFGMITALKRRYGNMLWSSVLTQLHEGLKNSATAEAKVEVYGSYRTRDIAKFAKENGYDSVLIKNISDDGGRSSEAVYDGDVYIFFDSNSLKSADVATYDDEGKIIPPSKRFNQSESDIRYALPEDTDLYDSDGNYIKPANMDKNSTEYKDRVSAIITSLKNVDNRNNILLAGLLENGVVDTDWLFADQPDGDYSFGELYGSKVADFAMNGDLNFEYYLRDDDCYSIKSLSKALLEYADEINALTNTRDSKARVLAFKVIDRAFELDGKETPQKYIDEYHASGSTRISRPTTKAEPKYTLSAGQIKKTLADYTQERSYTKAQAESIINSVLSSDLFEFGDRYGDMSKKSRAQAIDTLWQSLNTAKTQAELEQVLTDTADYIIQNMALESIYNDEANQAYVDTIDALKPYLHRLNLGSLKGEIKSKYGAKNTVYALWSAGKNKGIAVDTLPGLLAGDGIIIEDTTQADILFSVVDAYSNAVEYLQKQDQEMLSTAMTRTQLKELQFDIAVGLYQAICKTGNPTTYAKLPNKSDIKALSDLAQKLFEQNTQAQEQIDSLKAEIKELEKKATQLRNEAADAKDKNNSLRETLRLRDARAVEAQKKALEAQLEEHRQSYKRLLKKQEKAFKKRLQNVTDKYKSEAARWKNKYQESKAYNSEVNKVLYKTKKLKGVVVGDRLSATQFKGTNFKSTIGQLARIEYRGDFNTSGIRRVFSSLAAWYTPDNPILMTNSEDGSSAYYNAEVAAMLKAVAGNEKPLTQAQSDKIAALMEQSGAKTYKELQAWYTIKNLKSKYNAETKDLIKELASPTTYTVAELQQINNIVSYFTHFIETYNRIYRNGALVDALPVAQENIRIINDNKNVKLPLASRLVNAVFNHQKDANGKGLGSYMDTFADPMTVARNHDQYQNGFYTQTLTEFREAMVGTTITEMQMRANIEEFYDEHKQWYKELQKRTVEYNGAKLSAMQAMTMYLTLKRRQAQAGLAVSGFKFINQDGTTTRINGFAPGLDLYSITPDELNDLAITEQQKLYNSITETDREYLKLVEDMFNNQDNEYSSKSLKYKTDMKLNGYSNVLEDYYFPIYRASIGKTIDSSLYQGEIDRVSNLGFNKNTVTGAKGELYIEPITRIIDTHIKGIAMYANMATAIRDYDILFNLDIGGNPNKTVSLRTETENDWHNADRYFKTLLSDMQGISPVKGGTGIMGKMRSNYAKSVLGLNPKVWVTQLSSIFASTSRLDYASIMKASTLIASQTSDVDEYCLLAKARNTENTAALAQGVIETTGKIGDVLMKPIGTMDRFVVKWVYAAAQVQVEKEQGLKVGTKENKVAAGKLTQELILETQQNAMATERSAAMRSGSELLKSLTMFSSDAMKVIGRVIDAFGEHSVLKARLKTTTDATVKAQLEARLKEVNKSLRKSLGALVASSIFMALVAQAFRSLYNKDKDIEDDEDYGLQVVKNMSLDAVGNLMGGLPILKDLYSYLVDGYDIEDYSYSTINDLLSSVGDLVDLAEDLFSGSLTSRDVASNIKTVLFNLGKVVGLPVRQTYNLFYGLTSRISESTAYRIDDVFSQQSYVSDLTTAIEKEDMTLAGTIMELLLEDRTDADLSDTAMSKLLELYQAGYTSILPKSISTSITYNGETLSLTSSQLKAFENTYYAVNDVLETMIGSTTFNSLSEEQQAKAVQLLYNAYYYKALSELVEEDNNTTVGTLSNYMDADKAAMAYAVVATATSEKDSDGNTISGSKKASIIATLQKQGLSDGEILFILCYSAGYTIQDGDYKSYTAKRAKRLLLNYILKLNVTQAEKAAIAAECGFTVKNNRIITSDL